MFDVFALQFFLLVTLLFFYLINGRYGYGTEEDYCTPYHEVVALAIDDHVHDNVNHDV